MTEGVKFLLDGAEVEARPDETIWQVAHRHGNELPHLCYLHEPGYRGDGNCRACMVDIEGERVLSASCIRKPEPGMQVSTTSERASKAREMVIELLLADQDEPQAEFKRWADEMGVVESRFPAGEPVAPDSSHPAIAVDLGRCIQCNLCVRACQEVQANDVIGMAHRGFDSAIVFDMGDPMGDSSCVACGECVQVCPTNALLPAGVELEDGEVAADKVVDSVCPYCGVGCQVRFHVKDNKIVQVDGRDGPANQNRLCVKGRFGMDYAGHPHRLTAPLIRRDGVPKTADPRFDPANPLATFREASWDEALDLAASGLKKILDERGPKGLAGFGSAKGSNEEAYLVQKLVRTGFKTNSVDHCTRLCHASSVAALLETIGSGAVTAPVVECLNSDLIVVIGADPTGNHPVAATFIKNAAAKGTELVVIDPRRKNLANYAAHYLQFKAGSDVALLNALLNVIVTEELYDRQYVEAHTEGFNEIARHVKAFPPEKMEGICGIDADTLRTVARKIAGARGHDLLGNGDRAARSRHRQRAMPDLAGAAVRPCGPPRRGPPSAARQNNVQGASDAGLIPMMYPDYKLVTHEDAREKFEAFWDTELNPDTGLTVVEITEAIHDGDIRGIYVMGENPAMSDPDSTIPARRWRNSSTWSSRTSS